jgi:GNAT superfamily N-acetyltransferase
MMKLEVVPLKKEHLEGAVALASNRYKGFCDQVPLLPPCYGEVSTLLPLLHNVVEAAPGVAAIYQGRLVGFLTAWLMPSFRGKRAVFSPEWANAAEMENSRYIYEEMYTYLSASWVVDGYLTHLISTLADDRDDMDVWRWLGFGMVAVDALRSLQPSQCLASDFDIRRGGQENIEEVIALSDALQRHLASAPTFLVHTGQRDRHYFEEWLANPDNAMWLAYDGADAVAFMMQGPANIDACTIIRDEKTTSIVAAFTKEAIRGRGAASTLLNQALEWAHSAGYMRCAVDFEPMNPLASRFWSKYFHPVCYTLVRHIDTRGA